MRLANIQTALVPHSGFSPEKRRSVRRKATLANPKDFEALIHDGEDFIEADFEELREEKTAGGSGGPSYKNALFPAFLWKCLYVNYYV